MLASRNLADLTAADVENLLSKYEIGRPAASPHLIDLYRTALQDFAREGELSAAERADLKQLRCVLGLDDTEATEAEIDVLREVFRSRLQTALHDSHLSDNEKEQLERTTVSFGLSEAVRQETYKDEVMKVVQAAFDAAVKDGRLTEAEDQQLAAMAANFGVKLTHDDATLRRLERFRLLGSIEAGNIPEIHPNVLLQRGEKCYAQLPCRLHEKRSVTRAIGYSGPVGRIRIMKGLSWRYGYINVNRITSEELRQIDTGTLYITSKRLLFNGQAKNFNVQHKKIIQFTAYKDGFQIEKESGRDQYFLGEGDMELLGAILESVLRQARAD